MTSRPASVAAALLAVQLAILHFQTTFAARKPSHKRAPTITLAPSTEDLLASSEASTLAKRQQEHADDVAAGREHAYVVVLKGKDFGTDESKLSVRINGSPASDVLLHNSTAFSFRIPTHMVLDKKLLDTSLVEINVGPSQRRNIPLRILEPVFTKVEIEEYREQIIRQRLDSTETPTTANSPPQHSNKLHTSTEGGNSEFETEASDPSDLNTEEATSSSQEDEEERQRLDELVSHAERLLEKGSRADAERALVMLKEAIDAKEVRAMTLYGTAALSGTVPGVRRDVSRAVELLYMASEQGYPDAQAMLGFAYASGVAGSVLPKNVGAALALWTVAAEGGSTYAKTALAYRYLTGTDVQEDCAKASEFYKHVADEVVLDARETMNRQIGRQGEHDDVDDDTLSEIRPPTPSSMLASDRKRLTEGISRRVTGESNELVQYYRHSADRGDPGAQVLVGTLYYYGAMDVRQDVERARELFTLAAANGRMEAHAHLGFMHLRAGRNDSAVYHLRKAADNGEKLGYHGMGFVSLHGIGVEQNAHLAADYFAKAAEMDHPEAMFNRALMFLNGVGGPHSSKEAFHLFQKAARFGHMQSNHYVGVMFLRGMSPADRDCSMATHYLKLVAQQGVWNEVLSKALRAYERGAYADSLFRYLLAAHAGIELAQYNAAFMLERGLLSNSDALLTRGWGPKHDEVEKQFANRNTIVEESLELYQMSALQGYSDSMVRVGDLIFEEIQDFPRAASAYERAVKQRNAEAMFNLGWMHARGFGMNPDKHMAKRYFDQAKETEGEAFWPSTIALYFLKYSESVFAYVDKMSSLQTRLLVAHHRTDPVPGSHDFMFMFADILILAFLLCALVAVVLTRRKRLMRRTEAEPPREGASPSEDNGTVANVHPHSD